MKDDPDLVDIPVIMLSGLSDIENVVICLDAGADDYLQKPVDHTLLMTRVQSSLEKSRLRAREQEQLAQLQQEKQHVEELLRVLFPQPVIRELKKEKAVQPRLHENVSVLFADIVGFTSFCRIEKPEVVFLHLQQVMDALELAAARFGMQKIKTIGDAFLCVGGLWRDDDHPVSAAVKCGLEMVRVVPSLPAGWKLRVGIHMGPVISGVVGCRQYQFDVWGDTVNVAARIQGACPEGAVMVSDIAFKEVAGMYPTSASSMINLKGRGELKLHVIQETSRSKI
jgi:class 3 adenylate cyclase